MVYAAASRARRAFTWERGARIIAAVAGFGILLAPGARAFSARKVDTWTEGVDAVTDGLSQMASGSNVWKSAIPSLAVEGVIAIKRLVLRVPRMVMGA